MGVLYRYHTLSLLHSLIARMSAVNVRISLLHVCKYDMILHLWITSSFPPNSSRGYTRGWQCITTPCTTPNYFHTYLTMPGHNQPCKLSTVTWKPLPHHHKVYISHECTVAQWTHTLHQMVLHAPANTMPNRVNWSTQAYDQPCYLALGCSQTCGTLDWNDWLSHTTKKLPEISWDTILNDTDLYNY